MEVLFEYLRALNWAQWGVAICGFGVVLFTLISAGLQKHETARNNDEISKQNKEIIQLVERNMELAKEIETNRKKEFDATVTPDLRIKRCQIIEKLFEIKIKNFGNSTAEKVQITWDYAYAPQIITGIRELPPGKSAVFKSQIFPFEEIPDSSKAYDVIKKRYDAGNKALIVRLFIQHIWKGTPINSEYTVVLFGCQLRLI